MYKLYKDKVTAHLDCLQSVPITMPQHFPQNQSKVFHKSFFAGLGVHAIPVHYFLCVIRSQFALGFGQVSCVKYGH